MQKQYLNLNAKEEEVWNVPVRPYCELFFLLSLHSSEARLAVFGYTKRVLLVVSPLRCICCVAETHRFGLIIAAMGGETAPLTAVLVGRAACY